MEDTSESGTRTSRPGALSRPDGTKTRPGRTLILGAGNPADDVGPASIATFVPKDRSLSPTEIRIMLKLIEKVATLAAIRLGMRLYLQTMVRKSEAIADGGISSS